MRTGAAPLPKLAAVRVEPRETITLRLRSDELALIVAAAAAVRLSRSEFMRRAALERAGAVPAR